MSRLFSTILFTALFSVIAIAQERYYEPITDGVEVETQTYASKNGKDLNLDIYLPEYDAETKRVTLIYVHGGGFQEGTRNSKGIQKFCKNLATYGYVVASISYRLTRKGKPGGFGCDCPANEKLNTFYAAVEDIQDATFFLIQSRETFGIDPQKIILAGSSAGAEAALNAAYEPPYCYGLDSDPVSYAGVISMAGAIPDTSKIFDHSAVPSLLFHGTEDPLVPYATAPHHFCDKGTSGYLILHGSYTIAQKLKQLNVPYWLHTTCGAGHEIANTSRKNYFNEIVEFCYKYIVKNKKESRQTVIEGDKIVEEPILFNFCNK